MSEPPLGPSDVRALSVLYVTGSFWPAIGGLETAGAQLTTGLVRRGNRVMVVAGSVNDGGPSTLDGVQIHRRELLLALDARDAGRLASLRRELATLAAAAEPDVIHVACSPMTAYYVLGARLQEVAPLVLAFYAWWPEIDRPGDTVTRRAVEAADWVIACSDALLRDVRTAFPDAAPRSSAIHNAVDYPPGTPPVASPAQPVVAAAGHLREDKGFDVLIDAFALVRARFPAARLLLAGDGPDRAALEAAARPLGDAVRFLGWVPPEAMPDLLDRAAVVAVPSRAEAFGLIALEAALRARPVVASSIGGLPEVVDAPETGLLVDADDPGALAGAICSLLEDPARAARIGTAAMERARRRFTLERFLDEHERIYRERASRIPVEPNL